MKLLGPGTTVNQRYVVDEVLGQGSTAAVYRVHVSPTGVHFAMKEMRLERLDPADRQETVERFGQESALLFRLVHPAFPLLIDAFAEGDCLYLVMELVEGRTLEAIVEKNGPTPEGYLLPLAHELAVALDVLHRQPGAPIIFRDLKPSNVMVADDGTVKLVDFGIARIYKPGQATDTHPLGTPGFAPPEQWGTTQTTPQSDLYALGATLYYALTGTDAGLPGAGHPPLRQRVPQASEKMEALLECCLRDDPLQRPASAAEVLRKLEAIPPGPPTLGTPRRQRGPLWRRWLSSGYRIRKVEVGASWITGGFLILLAMLLLDVILPGRRGHQHTGETMMACKSNLKNIGTALEMYSTDHDGRFPRRLALLVPNYFVRIPTCPRAGRNTYSAGFASRSSPDVYTVVCRGTNHDNMRQGENYPQYNSTQGLVTQ